MQVRTALANKLASIVGRCCVACRHVDTLVVFYLFLHSDGDFCRQNGREITIQTLGAVPAVPQCELAWGDVKILEIYYWCIYIVQLAMAVNLHAHLGQASNCYTRLARPPPRISCLASYSEFVVRFHVKWS